MKRIYLQKTLILCNALCTLGLLLVVGCAQPIPVVYLGLDAPTDESAPSLGRVNIAIEGLSDTSDEIDLFVREKLAGLLVDSGEGLFLACQIKVSQPVAFTEPLGEGVRVSLRCDLSQPESGRIVKSVNFEFVSSAVGERTLKHCLTSWLDKFSGSLKSVSVRYSYQLARGLGNDDRRGRQAAEKGNYAEAFHRFQKAIDANPEDHAALYNAGLMCQAMYNPPRALTYYKRALRISPEEDYQVAIDRLE